VEHILRRLNTHTRTTPAVVYLTSADHTPGPSWTAPISSLLGT
jgi:hypothetical protein